MKTNKLLLAKLKSVLRFVWQERLWLLLPILLCQVLLFVLVLGGSGAKASALIFSAF